MKMMKIWKDSKEMTVGEFWKAHSLAFVVMGIATIVLSCFSMWLLLKIVVSIWG